MTEDAKPLRIIVRFYAKADRVEDVKALLTAMLAPTYAEPGEKAYDLFQCDDPRRFYFVETWASRAAFEFHSSTPHFKALGPKLDSLLETPVELSFVTPILH